jgi:cyclopropane-fatty-acyl-phospholipid synthase
MLLGWLFRNLVTVGSLKVVDADGEVRVFQGKPGPKVTIRLHRRSLNWSLAINPHLRLGEAYMDGLLTVENGRIYDFLKLTGINMPNIQKLTLFALAERARRWIRVIHQYNPVRRARQNVAHHYDLSRELYELFLDSDRQYSCAYFADPGDDLETAQKNKKYQIAKKLLLEDHQRILDIGCGWGGLALSLANRADIDVTGITLSSEQFEIARDRAEREGVSDRVEFALRDYRHQEGKFDRIVSVGMFEHVGVRYYDSFFSRIRDLLYDDGIALLHTIGRSTGPGATTPWIRKYIFPGGYIPALSETVSAIERSGLVVTDVEVLRLHYAETLRHWRQRFLGNWDKVAEIYDERFCRMWEFYLAASEIAFRYLELVVFQIQMGKKQNAAPMTRDYLYYEPAESKADGRGRSGSRAA